MDTLRGYVRNAEIFQNHAGAGILTNQHYNRNRSRLDRRVHRIRFCACTRVRLDSAIGAIVEELTRVSRHHFG
jgi:hypothetical protein